MSFVLRTVYFTLLGIGFMPSSSSSTIITSLPQQKGDDDDEKAFDDDDDDDATKKNGGSRERRRGRSSAIHERRSDGSESVRLRCLLFVFGFFLPFIECDCVL